MKIREYADAYCHHIVMPYSEGAAGKVNKLFIFFEIVVFDRCSELGHTNRAALILVHGFCRLLTRLPNFLPFPISSRCSLSCLFNSVHCLEEMKKEVFNVLNPFIFLFSPTSLKRKFCKRADISILHFKETHF